MSDFEFKSETQQNTNVEQFEQRLSRSSYIRVGLVALLSNFGFKGLFKNTKKQPVAIFKTQPFGTTLCGSFKFFSGRKCSLKDGYWTYDKFKYEVLIS